jgi:hypothetical protein
MSTSLLRLILTVSINVAISACAGTGSSGTESTNSSESVGPFPENYEDIVRTYLKTHEGSWLGGPYKITSAPQRGVRNRGLLFGGYDFAWVVCVTYEKSASRSESYGVVIRDYRVIHFVSGEIAVWRQDVESGYKNGNVLCSPQT